MRQGQAVKDTVAKRTERRLLARYGAKLDVIKIVQVWSRPRFNFAVERNGEQVFSSHLYGCLWFANQNPNRPVKARLVNRVIY